MRVPEHLRQLVMDAQRRRGVDGAARVIGISRPTLLSVLADVEVTSGTIALLERYRAQVEAARTGAPLAPMSIDRRGGLGSGGPF